MSAAKVTLLHSTPLAVSSAAAKLCVGRAEPPGWTDVDRALFLSKLVDKGHESVLEHANYSWLVEGLSRACLQQLARHRHVCLSVKSTRWALGKHAEIHVPEQLAVDPEGGEARKLFRQAAEEMMGLAKVFTEFYGNDVAKYFLPECVVTDLVLTTNLRELRHLLKVRTAPDAMVEFRRLAINLLETLPKAEQELAERGL